ncbi:hypothetical protein SAY86_016472 [Trapa natans]|uniref:RIN4 pathogenic type III effector avirulence factor Avr cleavage site domain-containing protein n=1 Tax=Trapa natans TaxID=22666 RepID=A0AAN7LCA6_TRANT|nr:hypothetical protein SAY86_016472 [Trapa natans]
MEQRAAVPRFGNWDKGENIGYTVYFDNVRKVRNGAKPYNPNDPEENPNLALEESKPAPPPPQVSSYTRPVARAPPNELQGSTQQPKGYETGGNRTVQERRARPAERGDVRWAVNSPPERNDNNIGARQNYPSSKLQGAGNTGGYSYGELHRRAAGVADVGGFERSSLHQQGKASGRGPVGSSPARERHENQINNGNGGGASGGRTRMRLIPQVDGNVDRGAALPKFGDWDVNNPSMAGGGFTQIFNQVREEKQQRVVGPSQLPLRAPNSPYNGPRRAVEADNKQMDDCSCCFPWGRK